jgi:hypothetical protein
VIPVAAARHQNNKKDKKDSGNNYRYEIWLRGVNRAQADEIRNKTLDQLGQLRGAVGVQRVYAQEALGVTGSSLRACRQPGASAT